MNRVYKKTKKKKKKVNLRPLKILFVLALITVCVYFGYKYRVDLKVIEAVQTFANQKFFTKVNAYTEDFDSMEDNSIAGQTLVEGKDGYNYTFTTLSSSHKKTYKEYKQNIDSSWSEKSYWGGTMRENGCGITTLATIASGYGSDVTPDDLREEYFPHLDAEKMKDVLEDMGIKSTDFYYHSSYLSKKYIMNWLRSNRPVIICVGNEDENKWTTSSHYMALLDINEKGFVYLSNPNGEEDEKTESRMV